MNEEIKQELINAAIDVRNESYSPYSNFAVGAAVLFQSGEMFTGCNVENASYGLAICAERSAICSGVAAGHRKILAVAIAATPLAPPCGACRQFIAEFGKDVEIISIDAETKSDVRHWTIRELLPEIFEL